MSSINVMLNVIWRRICEIFFMKVNNAIDVTGLSKQVMDATGQLTILKDINFTVSLGDSIAITGPSGSGKSTLLGILAGLDTPTKGDVIVNGQSIFAMDEDGRAAFRARHVGFVFQSFHLLPNLTALENVMLPLELTGKPAAETAKRLLNEVGLSHRLNHYPSTLSGGEQQRVSLARSFVQNPTILFADEPTGSLDEETGLKIIDLIFGLHRDHGTTLVLVTHDSSLANRCNHQITLHAGEIQSIT